MSQNIVLTVPEQVSFCVPKASFCVPKASFCVPRGKQQKRPSVPLQLENLALSLRVAS